MPNNPSQGHSDPADKNTDIQEQQRQEAGLNDDGAGPTEVSFRPAAKSGKSGGQQIGEGSYEATRDYQENIKEYLDTADVEADAEAAEPDSPEQARDLKKAEDEGLSHSKAPGQ